MLPRPPLVLALLAAALAAGCAPPTAPLYRDYHPPADTAGLSQRVAAAFQEAGWDRAEPLVPGVVATGERPLRDRGLYRVSGAMEAVVLGSGHLRVFVHPVRRSVFGGRQKLLALDADLRRALWPPLDAALARRGFVPLAPQRQRDAEGVRPP